MDVSDCRNDYCLESLWENHYGRTLQPEADPLLDRTPEQSMS
jgi:hypothetical protein